MPAIGGRRHAAALLGYVSLAVVFAWPLPLHLGTALMGSVMGDAGVYVWNLWLFRHEIVVNHHFPWFTLQVFSMTPPTPLTLHNYTSLASIVAFPLQPWVGVVGAFNLLTMASGVLAAWAMFALAWRQTGDAAAAWIAGVAFGFSPFMSARGMDHFSLVQTAPLPLFLLLLHQLQVTPGARVSVALGATVAAAFLCDPYYAVYCLLMGGFAIAYPAIVFERLPRAAGSPALRRILDVALVCLGGLIAGILVHGGGRLELLGLRVSVTRLYNPVLAFTVLAVLRLWLATRRRVSWTLPVVLPQTRWVFASMVTCLVLLAPVLTAMATHSRERDWINPRVWWRSSAAGLDLLALFVPNPLHPWFGGPFAAGLREIPGGLVENVGSIPWVLIALLVAAAAVGRRPLPRYWLAFVGVFGLMTLGPFIHVAGQSTYVPTPWALLRYVPIIGAARMPTRLMAIVMLGLAMLLAVAVSELRQRSRRPRLLASIAAALLVVELLPAPRQMHSAAIPSIYHAIAADPRPVRVLNVPFGLRDGLTSHGNHNASYQFYQTVHHKPLLGGYVSRLSRSDVEYYRRRTVTRALIDLSEGRELSAERWARAVRRAHDTRDELNVGYVVVHAARASNELIAFVNEAFDLTLVASDGEHVLYRTPLAPPLDPR